MNADDFSNRLRKRAKHLQKWARRWPTNAYRTYDWDIPQWPFAVDRYADQVVVQHFSRTSDTEEETARRDAVISAVEAVLEVDTERIHCKERRRQKQGSQYEAHDEEAPLIVEEDGLSFLVDLAGYVDTGLFLDHREMRRMVAREVADRANPTVANLFAYTGAFSVWAARAGATVTTVDLSNTYLDWARRNFALNDIDVEAHRFERSDAMRWLPQEHQRGARYDVVVLDPPTFSRSKKMVRDLDIQRDHLELIRGARALLRPNGVLFFSTNLRSFALDSSLVGEAGVVEISALTVPQDFSAGIHRAWRLVNDPAD